MPPFHWQVLCIQCCQCKPTRSQIEHAVGPIRRVLWRPSSKRSPNFILFAARACIAIRGEPKVASAMSIMCLTFERGKLVAMRSSP
ncbi:hypothetical protein BDR04DRAFT_588199 [Suillus decipiens]|nr:hypothetical protein BDR04DRAFT_588199 [Suillus decipiens]